MQPLKTIKPLTEFSGNNPQIKLCMLLFLRIFCFQKTLRVDKVKEAQQYSCTARGKI